MKNVLFILICFFLLGSFTFAKEPARISPLRLKTTQQQQYSGSATGFSQKIGLKQELQRLLAPRRQALSTNTGSCISWDQILIRNNLVIKAQEASKKLSWLIVLSSKIGFDIKNFSSLAKNLETLSSQIEKDCSLSDFQKHRQQIRANLDSLKTEISLLKQYILRLRNR